MGLPARFRFSGLPEKVIFQVLSGRASASVDENSA